MNKTDYMNTLRQELEGLPGTIIEEALWHYEGLFVNGMMAGKSDEEIAAALPKPSIVAAQRRAKLKADALKQDLHPGNLARVLVALLVVLFFNLLMVVPAIVYSALLFASYICGLSFYFAGILIAAASLAGVPQMTFHIPHGYHHVDIHNDHHRHFGHGDVTVDISEDGIYVKGNHAHDDDNDDDGDVDINFGKTTTPDLPAVPTPPADAVASQAGVIPATPAISTPSVPSVSKPLRSDGIPIIVGNHLGMLDIFRGLGLILGGIALFLFALFMTRMTFVGFKRYLTWNMSLLHLSDKK